MKHKYWSLILSIPVSLSLCLQADMPEPYRSVEDLPFDSHGWFLNAPQLTEQLNQKPIQTVIEVGSWLGCSTRFIAKSIPDGAKVYAVDTWRGSTNEEATMKDPRIPYLYQLFLSNVKHAGLTDKIIPVRMASLEAALALNVQADLIYIDASHDTVSVYNDIIAWYPHLKADGIMCGDDWQAESVRIGVQQAAKKLNRKVIGNGAFWRYE